MATVGQQVTAVGSTHLLSVNLQNGTWDVTRESDLLAVAQRGLHLFAFAFGDGDGLGVVGVVGLGQAYVVLSNQ